MLPINDFNFVVCGLATFAATVGYACTRKTPFHRSRDSPILTSPELGRKELPQSETPSTNQANTTPVSEPLPQAFHAQSSEDTTKSTMEPTTPSRHSSLKRKIPHDGFDDVESKLGYPHNLENIYPPNKRSRTPSSESGASGQISGASAENKQENVAETKVRKTDKDTNTAVIKPLGSPVQLSKTLTPKQSPTTTPDARENSPAQSPPSTPRPASFDSPSGGFAAFAGSTSPFAATKLIQSSKSRRSIWASSTKKPNEPEVLTSKDTISRTPPSKKHAIAAVVASPKPSLTHVTGEENEDVELELKGVKLYIKRGDRPFTDGMLGHIKLLSDRTTLTERLLFRREPLWKVSMNIRVHPTVRCTFDEAENAVRLILREPVELPAVPQQDLATELVVYALKPGRSCSKQDFKEFAEALVACAHFKSSAS